jgi:tetrapyrrole methylase family protein/MazG family protein
VAYAVPGHPLVAEETVRRLLKLGRQRQIEVTILPAMSCLDAIFAALGLDPAEGMVITEAARLAEADLRPDLGLLVLQVYDRLVASEVKLTLLPLYGDEWPAYLLRAAGVAREERIVSLPLYAIDRQPWIDHLTSLYVPPARIQERLDRPGLRH